MKLISETERCSIGSVVCGPFQRMGALGFPASGQRTWPSCTPAWQGTDSSLCGAYTPACGGKHVHEIILIQAQTGKTLWNFVRRRRELIGSSPASPRFNSQTKLK